MKEILERVNVLKIIGLLLFSFTLQARIVVSPGNMGPKALPVQKVGRVTIDRVTYTDIYFSGSIEFEKEYSFNPQVDFFIPWNDFVALLIQIEPIEIFSVSEALQAERGATNKNGIHRGDLYFGTNLHLFHNKKEEFNLHLNFLTKTSSGKGRGDARHTDAMAYQIDLRFRKKISWLRQVPIMPEEILGYTGLLSWHTSDSIHNEAFCWGLKLVYGPYDIKAIFELAGYSGWQNNDDRPIVGSFEFRKMFDRYDFFARYQYGFRDQVPHTMVLGLSYKYQRPRFF